MCVTWIWIFFSDLEPWVLRQVIILYLLELDTDDLACTGWNGLRELLLRSVHTRK